MGKRQKTLPAPSRDAHTTQVGEGEGRVRWVFAYTVDGDLRFISHDDTLRMFRRALARAELPVRFSEGFNPLPRIRIPLPLPVGIASNAESIVMEFDRPADPADALRRLQQQTPAGIRMIGVRPLGPQEGLQFALVRYRLEPDGPLPDDLEMRIRPILETDSIEVKRTRPKDNKTHTIEIRPYIVAVSVQGDAIEFTLRVTPDGTAKPAEIAGLVGYDANAINHRIRRMEVQWQ